MSSANKRSNKSAPFSVAAEREKEVDVKNSSLDKSTGDNGSSSTKVNSSEFVSFAVTTALCVAITQGLVFAVNVSSKLSILSVVAGLAIAIQWIVYIFQASGIFTGNKPTERFYDFTGSITYISLVSFSFIQTAALRSLRKTALSGFVLVWAARLGSFLFSRINREGGRDSRFDAIRSKFFKFWNFWTIQGLWVLITALPVFLAHQTPMGPKDVLPTDLIGGLLWIAGFLIESTADAQKTMWKRNPENNHKFINTGLWAYSRHPNYFGEIILWIGVFVVATGEYSHWRHYITVISPIFVFLLLIYVSGIPLLEIAGKKRWGEDPKYKAYVNNTPVLIPFIGRKGNAAF